MAAMQRYDNVVQTAAGLVIPSASVAVLVKSSGATATIYSDEGTTPIANPITTGIDGTFWFYAADDDYVIQATYGGVTRRLDDVTLHAPESWRQFVVKTASVPVNNSTVYKDDEELFFSILAGETWEFAYFLSITTAALADFKYACITTPGGAGGGSGRTAHIAFTNATTLADADTKPYGQGNVILHGGAVTAQPLIIHGYFAANIDVTAAFRWAQNAADPSDTHVNIGSWLIARKVSLV